MKPEHDREPTLFDFVDSTALPAAPTGPTPLRVEVTRSNRRRRTVGSQLVGDTIRIVIPSWLSKADEARWIEQLRAKYEKKRSAQEIDLPSRASTLARRYDLPHPREIRWVGDLKSRWGSCTPVTGTIRISSRLIPFPEWVRDYVIVHELAHLEVADHSPAFWRLVNRYERTERARGYLIAMSGDVESD